MWLHLLFSFSLLRNLIFGDQLRGSDLYCDNDDDDDNNKNDMVVDSWVASSWSFCFLFNNLLKCTHECTWNKLKPEWGEITPWT